VGTEAKAAVFVGTLQDISAALVNAYRDRNNGVVTAVRSPFLTLGDRFGSNCPVEGSARMLPTPAAR
jgi:hypothetical protein